MESVINQKLMKAYCSLVKKTDEKITVSALCEKADVARATFYLYYKDLDAYVEAVRKYIVEKFRKQAVLLMDCSDSELHNLCKKENFVLNDDDIELLAYFTSQTRYIGFAVTADVIFHEVDPLQLNDEEFFIKNKKTIEIFFNGYIPILYFGIIKYDQAKFEKEMLLCRSYYKMMLQSIK